MAHRNLLGAMSQEIPTGLITGATITNGGTGYTSAPTVTVNSSTGSGAVLTATVDVQTGTVTSITAESNGSGYTSSDTVTISGGGGTGATATLTIGSLVGSFYGTAGLTRFSAIPYLIDPQLNIGIWHLDHGQAHDDFTLALPGGFGFTGGIINPTIDFVDMNFDNPDQLTWWTFANHQQHLIAQSVLPQELVFPFF
jgi:hypothetical protein